MVKPSRQSRQETKVLYINSKLQESVSGVGFNHTLGHNNPFGSRSRVNLHEDVTIERRSEPYSGFIDTSSMKISPSVSVKKIFSDTFELLYAFVNEIE